MLPVGHVRDRLLTVLSSLANIVVLVDITLEQFSDGKLKKVTAKTGQATHFMAYKGQSQREAYGWGMEKIFGKVEDAVNNMKQTPSDWEDRGMANDRCTNPLAESLHTLQDSFSPAHVERRKDGYRWLIVRLFVWSEQKKKDHEAADHTWLANGEPSDDANLSPLGQACYNATIMLLKYYVLCVANKTSEAERQKKELIEKYLTLASS